MDFYGINIIDDEMKANTSIFTINNTGGRVAITHVGSQVAQTELKGLRINTSGSVHKLYLGSGGDCDIEYDETDVTFSVQSPGVFKFTNVLKIQNAPTIGQGSTPSGSGDMECNGNFWAVKVYGAVWG